MKSFAQIGKFRPRTRPPFYSILSGLLQMRRASLGLTQKQMALKLGHGDPAQVNGYETGRVIPNEANLARLADVYDVNPHQLIEMRNLDRERKARDARLVQRDIMWGIA